MAKIEEGMNRPRAEKLEPVTDEMWSQVNEFNRKIGEEFLNESTHLSERTLTQYTAAVRIIFWWVHEQLDDKKIIDIKSKDYLKYQNWLQRRGLSESGIRFKRSVVSSLNGYIILYYEEEFPTFRNFITKQIKINKTGFVYKKEPLTPDEYRMLCDELEKQKEWQKLAYVKFTYSAGCRREESKQLLKEVANYEPNIKMVKVKDDEGNLIPLLADTSTGDLIVEDESFSGFSFRITMIDDKLAYVVKIEGKEWVFTNQFEDGTYYYLNQYNRLDKIITAPSALFTGYEDYASGRGYIWSRSVPLLKENFILGSGADTFVIEFPQQDYVNKMNYGYSDQIITKPHNLYLQIGVQTGALSLLAFLVFYCFYFLSGIKLYIRSRYDNFYSKVGVAILVGTFGYMVAGIANDSSITVAPLFWVMMELGIAVNEKARSIVNEEKHHRDNNNI